MRTPPASGGSPSIIAAFMSPVRARAYRILRRALGGPPMLHQPLASIRVGAACDALLSLESAFRIDLEVDEALDARTIGGLLDLVEKKVAAAGGLARCQVFDFTAYRAALTPEKP